MRKYLLGLLVLLSCMLIAVSCQAAALYSMALVTKNAVNIRKTPGGNIVDRLQKGECVSIIEATMSGGKEWDRIIVSRRLDNVVICGYVDASFLEDITDKYTGIAEAAPGDRHIVLRYPDGRTVAVGETFMDNLSIGHWPPVAHVYATRFMSAALGMDGRLYTSTGYSRPDYLKNWAGIDAVFPCMEDFTNVVVRRTDGRIECDFDVYKYLFPERYTGAEQVVFTPFFSAALKDGQVMVTASQQSGMQNILAPAEGLSGIRKIACGKACLACLDLEGNMYMYSNEPDIQDADRWQNVVDIAAAGGFVVGVMRDGTVRMAGTLEVRNRNYADDSGIIVRENYENILSSWHDIVEIRASWRMIVGRQADGHICLLYPNRYQ
ncbi:MAG: hypothetical protein IJ242_02980 [Clostridia bacterium]|nr:hypothetical protein [Clostridia bacterium]